MTAKTRFRPIVCKPCWELKYCPYGPLVEQFPLPGMDEEYDIDEIHGDARKSLESRELGEREFYAEVERFLFSMPSRWEGLDGLPVEETRCGVFGHVCPVFLMAEPFTETCEVRDVPSRHVPRGVLLEVVRRDGQRCQVCLRNLRDDEIELDHIIPVSKGGPSTAANLRVSCRDCNRRKSDSLDELLGPPIELEDQHDA